MAKVNRYFFCSYCNRSIPFGDEDAVEYDGNLYCSERCIVDSLDINEFDWSEEYENDITNDESNGYGIIVVNDSFYSNGHYAVFERCPFEFDTEYKEYFGLHENKEVEEMLSVLFDKNKDFFESVKDFKPRCVRRKHCLDSYVEVLDHWFFYKEYMFIIKRLNDGNLVPADMSICFYDAKLLIILNGKMAAIAENTYPLYNPELFEEIPLKLED